MYKGVDYDKKKDDKKDNKTETTTKKPDKKPGKLEAYRIEKYQKIFTSGTYLMEITTNDPDLGDLPVTMAIKEVAAGELTATLKEEYMR